MASSTKNVKLGPCNVFFDGIDLGLTQGGCEVTVSTETHKVEVDQFGKTAINELIIGRMVKAKVSLAETTLRNLVATMPGSTIISDGSSAVGTFAFAANATSSTSVTIGTRTFTFQVGVPANAYQVQIGATTATSLDNLRNTINLANMYPELGSLKASLNTAGTIVTVSTGDAGSAGNAIAISGSLDVTVSGASLAGGAAETKARVEVNTSVGLDLLSVARVLRLHPQSKPANDFSEDFFIFQAATPGALNFAYKLDAERIYNIEFMGYPDPLTGKLFAIGSPLA